MQELKLTEDDREMLRIMLSGIRNALQRQYVIRLLEQVVEANKNYSASSIAEQDSYIRQIADELFEND